MSTTTWISRARPPDRLTSPTPFTVWMTRAICLSVSSVSVRRLMPSARDDQRHHRVGVGIDLGDDRRQQRRRHVPDRARDLLAHVVGGVVDLALEDEADGDLAAAFGDARLDLVDAGDAADGLFHRLDDRRRHLVRAGARQLQRDADGGRVGLREQVDAEAAEREDAEHHQRHHQHRGGDRTADAELRQHAADSHLVRVDLLRDRDGQARPSSVSTSVTATARRP